MASYKTIAPTIAGLLVGLATMGCGGYGQVSPAAYEHAKALYTASNLQSAASVERAEELIAADLDSGALTAREAGWLRDIVADCRAGNWKAAQKSARQIMEDQVRR